MNIDLLVKRQEKQNRFNYSKNIFIRKAHIGSYSLKTQTHYKTKKVLIVKSEPFLFIRLINY